MNSYKQFVHFTCSEIAKTLPLNIAIEEEQRQITYADMELKSGKLARFLKDSCPKKEAIIGVVLPASIELVVSLLSIFRAGAVYLPIDLKFPIKRLEQIFTISPPEIMIIHRDCIDEILLFLQTRGLARPAILVPDDMTLSDIIEWYPPDGNAGSIDISLHETYTDNGLPEDGNYIFYTSGSSGEAKPIMGCHISLSHFIQWEIKEFGIGSHHKISQLTQITFDASLRDIFIALCTGSTLCIPSEMTKNNTHHLIGWLNERKISLVHCVPSLFRIISRTLQSRHDKTGVLGSLEYILLAGEVLYAKDISEWRKAMGAKIEIVNLYGATETTLVKTFHRIREIPPNPSQAIHVGKPIDNTFVAIINDGSICRIGEIGEVYIKTPYATKGYYKNEALTASVFVQNPLLKDKNDIVYRTGDMGRYLAGRDIEILGRLDNQVKINGIRVELNEVEQAILVKEGIDQVVVKSHKNNDNLQELICYYTGSECSAESLQEFLKPSLSAYAVPTYFVWLEKFPLNLNGKIDKKALPLPEPVVMGSDFIAPVGEVEIRLEAIWKEILGLKRVGRNISFFIVGGHSLRAVQLLSRIFSDLQVDLKVVDIFSHPTIEQQASLIQSSQRKIFLEIPVIKEDGNLYEASHGQQRLWTLAQLEEGHNAYNMAGAYIFSGKLDTTALEKAFAAFIERHEILRTTFVSEGRDFRQKVHSSETMAFDIGYTDIRSQKLTENDPYIRFVMDEEARRPFDLEKGPLLKTLLLHIADEKYIFLLTLHHIISDDWSMQILVREVSALYNVYHQGNTPSLPGLKIQYKDFSSWHNKLLKSEAAEADRRFWLEQFTETSPVLNLPIDFMRPEIFSSNGNDISFTLDAGTTELLVKLSRQQESTMFMILLSAVCLLIYRTSGQRDQVIGSPMAGRMHKDTEELVGLFINPLPVRIIFNEAENFSDLLEVVKKATLSVYAHQLYSLDMLSVDVSMKRDFSRSLFFDVAVMLQNTAGRDYSQHAFEGLKVDYLPTTVVSKHDWEFYFSEEEPVINFTIIYNTDIYKADTVYRAGKDLVEILGKIAINSHYVIDESDHFSMIAERTRPISTVF